MSGSSADAKPCNHALRNFKTVWERPAPSAKDKDRVKGCGRCPKCNVVKTYFINKWGQVRGARDGE